MVSTPCSSPSAERHSIWAELFEVDAVKLREFDELEAPYGYWRETVFLQELSREAEIYVHAAPPPSGFYPCRFRSLAAPSLKLPRASPPSSKKMAGAVHHCGENTTVGIWVLEF